MSKAYELGLQKATFEASDDLSDYQYHGVIMNTSEKIALASDGVKILGVLQDTPEAANRACIVAYGGITKAMGGGVIEEGHEVQVDSSGHFVTKVSGVSIGTAAVPCGGSGQLFSILFNAT